jgi:hypothetical protein
MVIYHRAGTLMQFGKKAPLIEPEWHEAPLIEPEWGVNAPLIEPEWDSLVGYGRFAVSDLNSKSPILESLW